MTDGTTAAAAPAPAPTSGSGTGSGSQRRKPRRRRNAGKKNESGNQQKGGKGGASKSGNKKASSGGKNNSNSPPPPPQIKITIRNIQNSEKFGSVKSVLEVLVSKLIETCVEKKANNQYAIELDRTAVRYLITEEEEIKEHLVRTEKEKARLLEEEKNETKDSNQKIDDVDIDPAENDVDGVEKEKAEGGKEEKPSEEPSIQTKDTSNDNNKLEVIVASKAPNNLPTIIARPLYVVPPRKTSRRGERGGTAYVLLIGPKIENKSPVATVQKEEVKNDSSPSPQDGSEKKKPSAGETAGSDPSDGGKQAPGTSPPEEKTINYPQELAKGRLLLSNTLKALTELTAVDGKAQEFVFSGCIVEQSMNGKTWKMFQNNNSRPDRREGTIENTADFKEWMENITKQKEELKARPKPTPGGGMTGTMTAATPSNGDELEEDGQLVSSLVQHLRAKKLDAKRKKSQKKKKKEESNKTAANNCNNKGDIKTVAGQSENEKKKKKRNEKKNRKNNNSGTAASGAKGDAGANTAAAKKAKRKKKERAKKKEKAKTVATTAGTTAGSKAPTAVLKPQTSAT